MAMRLLMLCCLLVSASHSYSWSGSVHRDIGVAVFEILSKKEQRYYKNLVTHMPQKNLSFHDLSPWVDSVRNEPILELFDGKVPQALRFLQRRHSGAWHYENSFYFPSKQHMSCSLKNKGKLEEALTAIDKALRENTTKKQEAMLIAFAMHLLEDAHQPLHTGTLVRSDCSLDLGGNRFCLQKYAGKCILNLHQLWDKAYGTSKSLPDIKHQSYDFDSDFYLDIEIQRILMEGESYLPNVYSIEENRSPYEAYIENSKTIAAKRLQKSVERVSHFLKVHYERQK